MTTISGLDEALGMVQASKPTKIVLSSPRSKTPDFLRVVLQPMPSGWQLQKHTKTQVFHENIQDVELQVRLAILLQEDFCQMTAQGTMLEHSLRITGKGKLLLNKKAVTPSEKPQLAPTHNRQKKYLIPEGTIVAPLVDMGIFTKDGQVVRQMHDKYRQINRFVELVDDALRTRQATKLTILDFGCGKSYLTFILYYYLTQVRGIEAEITGLDLKKDVVDNCNAAAKKYGYDKLRFEVGDIADYEHKGKLDMLVTLHACDMATDIALALAVQWQAEMIFSVPCCQHELSAQMHSDGFSILTRYGIVQERIAALMTDALRANLLQACGYKAQLLEFVDFAHTPKNILIRATKSALPPAVRKEALAEAKRLMQEFHFDPALHRLLSQKGFIDSI